MPLPEVKKNEPESAYMQRCMTFLSEEDRENEQKVAMCLSTYRNYKQDSKGSTVLEAVDFSFSCDKYLEEHELGWTEELDEYNFVIPESYCDASDCEDDEEDDDEEEDEDDEEEEEVSAASLWENIRKKKERLGKKYKPAKPGDKDRPDPSSWKKAQQSYSGYKYKNLKTGELYTYDKKGSYSKDGVNLFYVGKANSDFIEQASNIFALAAEYQGRKIKLGKPFLTPKGPKKRAVYVKNDRGNVVLVRFGDPNMRIRKSDPGRRKNFRARHNCQSPGPRWKARYWSCKFW
jgi:hypothetical protein